MKKLLMVLLCAMAVLVAGCGDKFAKEKEAMSKAEETALSVEVPVLVRPVYSKNSRPTQEDYAKYHANIKKLIAIEENIIAVTRKSDSTIAELLKKTENDSEKKGLNEFKEKLRQNRIAFVKKVSKGRLWGDTYIVGAGSTWQEIEMVYGQPLKKTEANFEYEGIAFSDWYTKGVPPKGYKFVSDGPQGVFVNDKCSLTSDAGIRMGMSKDEVLKTLKAKYKKRIPDQKDEMYVVHNSTEVLHVIQYSIEDTFPYHVVSQFKDGKLKSYVIAPY